MPQGGSMRAQIGELIIATSIVQLANGFFGTFFSLRVAIENFDAPGLVLSAYFAGFTLGALRCGRIIERVGHIRGRCRNRCHASVGRIAGLGGPAGNSRVRLCRYFHHH